MTRSDLRQHSVSILGSGAIGTAVGKILLEAGYRLYVWNRTPQRGEALVGAGAEARPSAGTAISASTLSLITVTDYRAVEAILLSAGDAVAGRTIVVLCTGSPEEAASAADIVTRNQGRYLDGGLQTHPDDLGTDRATLLYSGSETGFAERTEALSRLGKPRYLGSEPSAAAVFDLALFGLWYDAQVGLLRALETVSDAGVDQQEFATPAQEQLGHVVDAVAATARELDDDEYPRGPADLAEHLPVLDLLLRQRDAQLLGDGGMTRVRQLTQALIEAGHGDEGLTALIGRPQTQLGDVSGDQCR